MHELAALIRLPSERIAPRVVVGDDAQRSQRVLFVVEDDADVVERVEFVQHRRRRHSLRARVDA